MPDPVPSEMSAIFAYPIAWQLIDKSGSLEAVFRPFIAKQILEFFGQMEEELVEFLVDLLRQHKGPRDIVKEMTMVLETNAEALVLRLWTKLCSTSHDLQKAAALAVA